MCSRRCARAADVAEWTWFSGTGMTRPILALAALLTVLGSGCGPTQSELPPAPTNSTGDDGSGSTASTGHESTAANTTTGGAGAGSTTAGNSTTSGFGATAAAAASTSND